MHECTQPTPNNHAGRSVEGADGRVRVGVLRADAVGVGVIVGVIVDVKAAQHGVELGNNSLDLHR